ncbi:MAG TPA: portal protein, partial [Agitococcus sp.]|nr:portal protein [Agitococcus sp.]
YGRSPAMDVLPSIKTLNEQKKTMLKQGHRAVDPVLLAHDDGVLDSFSLKPGSINFGGITADGTPLVQPLPVGSVAIGKEMMDEERNLINDAFLITIFQILTESPQMTATEVLERTKEKGILLAPTIGRQQSEYLGPLIEREIDVLTKQRLIPPMPQALIEAKGEYRIEYDSPLSRAQRAEEASGLMRTVETAIQVVNVTQDPSPLDYFDWDVIIPEMGTIQAVPERWMRSQEQVEEMRAGRAKQQEQQQLIQAAPAAAAMIKAGAIAQKNQAPR